VSLHVVDQVAEQAPDLRVDTFEVSGAWGAFVVGGGGATCVGESLVISAREFHQNREELEFAQTEKGRP
jgi:hypothetical protein